MLLVALAGAASAHHSANTYDQSGVVKDVEAAVVTVNWSNPHASFVVVTKEGLFWTFESVSIGIFTSHGWTKDALKPGEWAVFHYAPRLDGAPGGGFLVGATLPDGRELSLGP